LTKALQFTPRHTPDNFKSFFCAAEGWGILRQTREGLSGQVSEVAITSGQLAVARLHLASAAEPKSVQVTLNGQPVASRFQPSPDGVAVVLNGPLLAKAGDTLSVRIG